MRVKDKRAKLLSKQAASVNFVWNYINEFPHHSIKERRAFLSSYDLDQYTSGASKELGIAQRARKKNRLRAIHAKIANRRKDEHHKLTTQMLQENAAVFVGNVSSKSLTQTKMAKSVLDAGWGQFKTILEYKCAHAGVVFEEVNES